MGAGHSRKRDNLVLQDRLFGRPFGRVRPPLGIDLDDLDLLHLAVHLDSALGVDILGNKSKYSRSKPPQDRRSPLKPIPDGDLNGVAGSWKGLVIRVIFGKVPLEGLEGHGRGWAIGRPETKRKEYIRE